MQEEAVRKSRSTAVERLTLVLLILAADVLCRDFEGVLAEMPQFQSTIDVKVHYVPQGRIKCFLQERGISKHPGLAGNKVFGNLC